MLSWTRQTVCEVSACYLDGIQRETVFGLSSSSCSWLQPLLRDSASFTSPPKGCPKAWLILATPPRSGLATAVLLTPGPSPAALYRRDSQEHQLQTQSHS